MEIEKRRLQKGSVSGSVFAPGGPGSQDAGLKWAGDCAANVTETKGFYILESRFGLGNGIHDSAA